MQKGLSNQTIRYIWNILNSIIVVDGFKSFFVDVGPNLTKDIKDTGRKPAEMECGERNVDSMSLETVDKMEIIAVVNRSTN